jgi:hypothetical protein
MSLRPTLAVPLPLAVAVVIAVVTLLPTSGFEVMTPVSRLPTIGHPIRTWTRLLPPARRPNMALAFPLPIARRPGVAGTRRRNGFVAHGRGRHTDTDVDADFGCGRHRDRAQGNQRAQQDVSHGHRSFSSFDDFPHWPAKLPQPGSSIIAVIIFLPPEESVRWRTLRIQGSRVPTSSRGGNSFGAARTEPFEQSTSCVR